MNKRATRSTSKLSHFNAEAKDSKKVENSEKSEPRITRSLYKKPTTEVQPTAPIVEPAKKTVVKRLDFVQLKTFNLNDIVLAKQKFSCPWPARILSIEKKRVSVFFFGDKRTGYVNPLEIYDFSKSMDALKQFLLVKKKPRGFISGIREVELLLGVNSDVSLLNTI